MAFSFFDAERTGAIRCLGDYDFPDWRIMRYFR
jgi:hypothetical protein